MQLPGHLAILAFAVSGYCSGLEAAEPRGIGTLAKDMSPPIARCLIRREPELVQRWLRTLPGTAEENRLVIKAQPRFPACFGEPLGNFGSVWIPAYDQAGIRAALVRALLQARRESLPTEPPLDVTPAWYTLSSSNDRPRDEIAAIVAADLGACLAKTHWSSVVAMVKAVDPKVESMEFFGFLRAEEAEKREIALIDAKLSKIIPSIAGCAPAGLRLRVNRLRLRRLLEEAAYHMISGHPGSKEGNDNATTND